MTNNDIEKPSHVNGRARQPDLPFAVAPNADAGKLQERLGPTRKEAPLVAREILHQLPRPSVAEQHGIGLEEAPAGYEVPEELVVERRGSLWIVRDGYGRVGPCRTSFDELFCEGSVQGCVDRCQLPGGVLSESVAECAAVSGSDCVSTCRRPIQSAIKPNFR